MAFSRRTKEEVLIRSHRHCCVCHRFAGRDLEVHHIVSINEGGDDSIDNAIALCYDCHAEAGHYNSRHPRGTKYSPAELRWYRDLWWRTCQSRIPQNSDAGDSNGRVELSNTEPFQIIRKETGTLSSFVANIPVDKEVYEFEGRLIGRASTRDNNGPTLYELYALRSGKYLVYSVYNHRGDWTSAHLAGVHALDEFDPPLTLERVQVEYPILATAVGLMRVHKVKDEDT